MLSNCVLYLAMGLAAATPEEAAWVGFRGPLPAGVHSDRLPVQWSPTENIAWQAKIDGYGQSSPVVWGNQVFVTSVVGRNKETCKITSYDIATGKDLWQLGFENATPQESSNYISKAAPTPVVDATGVIALFEGGNLVAVKHDGNNRWQWNLVEKFGPIKTRHGLGSSLAQDKDLVFVWIERMEDPYLLAINKETGAEAWIVPGLKATSWSTPVLMKAGEEQHLVLAGNGMIRGHNPSSGETLWTLEGVSGNTTPSPQPAGDGLLLLGATNARGEGGGPKASPSNAMVRVEKQADGKFAASIIWKAKRATCSFGSPIVHKGLAYYVNVTGVLFCLDAQSGEEVYSQRLAGSIWATPLAVDDRIYFVGHKGTTSVVQAGREFKLLTENRLWVEEAKAEASPEQGKQAEKKDNARSEKKDNAQAEKKDDIKAEKTADAPAEKKDEKSAEGERKGRGEGRREASSSGGVLYAVAAVPGRLLIRRGDVLYCVSEKAATK